MVSKQPRGEVLRAVTDGRNFVGRWRVGRQSAFVTPAQFFAGKPAHTLDEGAFDLTDVDRRIDRITRVVQDISTQ